MEKDFPFQLDFKDKLSAGLAKTPLLPWLDKHLPYSLKALGEKRADWDRLASSLGGKALHSAGPVAKHAQPKAVMESLEQAPKAKMHYSNAKKEIDWPGLHTLGFLHQAGTWPDKPSSQLLDAYLAHFPHPKGWAWRSSVLIAIRGISLVYKLLPAPDLQKESYEAFLFVSALELLKRLKRKQLEKEADKLPMAVFLAMAAKLFRDSEESEPFKLAAHYLASQPLDKGKKSLSEEANQLLLVLLADRLKLGGGARETVQEKTSLLTFALLNEEGHFDDLALPSTLNEGFAGQVNDLRPILNTAHLWLYGNCPFPDSKPCLGLSQSKTPEQEPIRLRSASLGQYRKLVGETWQAWAALENRGSGLSLYLAAQQVLLDTPSGLEISSKEEVSCQAFNEKSMTLRRGAYSRSVELKGQVLALTEKWPGQGTLRFGLAGKVESLEAQGLVWRLPTGQLLNMDIKTAAGYTQSFRKEDDREAFVYALDFSSEGPKEVQLLFSEVVGD